MAASAKKKNKKGKTLTLNDFLAEDGGGGTPAPSFPSKSTSWADETDDLDGDVATSWHTEEDTYRAPPIDRSILPTAPRSAREPNIDRSKLPRSPPYTAFLGNLPYDITEDSIKDFFRGLAVSAVRLPREPNNPERLKGFGYAEFDDLESLLRALNLNEEKETVAPWEAEIGVDEWQTWVPTRRTATGELGQVRTMMMDLQGGMMLLEKDHGTGTSQTVTERGHGGTIVMMEEETATVIAMTTGTAETMIEEVGCGFSQGCNCFFVRLLLTSIWPAGTLLPSVWKRFTNLPTPPQAPQQRPKLNLKPRSVPKEEEGTSSGGTSPAIPPSSGGRSSSIFGGAKPVDTAAKEREVEERLKKEEERLQRQLEVDKSRGPERKMRDRDPSWRNEETHSERSRTESESSQPGSTSGRGSRCLDGERSGDNEVFSGREGNSSPGSSPRPTSTGSSKEPLKVMPAPPPKENAWAKRSAVSTRSSEGDGRTPVSPVSPSGSAPPKFSSPSYGDERGSEKGEVCQ
ncbi:hypothetical protein XENORESO_020708 [Xenotaenia resolanae]|uniref:RRM domain-containing protein n=1 Tax=Xenotaenia resolanae TaxID=208358 RepID=A0ABV0WVJ2_9TELE